ncbi:MAG: glycosyltransferase family 1 protein [Bacteroidia bacterium]
MYNKHIHIIAFDLPFPPNYGGSTDMFFKIVALKKLGIAITLHVFLYGGKEPSIELENEVDRLYYYSRKRRNPFAGSFPYIVRTRSSNKLLKRLLEDNDPILFEGLHTTWCVEDERLKDRVKIVRAHNVEHNYYEALAMAEERIWKTQFFKLEAKRLKSYEKVLNSVQGIAAISPLETDYFQKEYGDKTHYIPAFHAHQEIESKTGKGDFVLYHGNLSVPENSRAASYLVEEVFSKLEVKCVIAGSNPPKSLVQAIDKHPHIELRANISTEEILSLITNAHINLLVTFQSTGIKLKLLNSIYKGRFIIANPPMIQETGLEDLCSVGNTPKELASLVQELFLRDFTDADMLKRNQRMWQTFSNENNAKKMAKMLMGE